MKSFMSAEFIHVLPVTQVWLVYKARAQKSQLSKGSKILNWLIREASEPGLPWHFFWQPLPSQYYKSFCSWQDQFIWCKSRLCRELALAKRLMDLKVWHVGCKCQNFVFILVFAHIPFIFLQLQGNVRLLPGISFNPHLKI